MNILQIGNPYFGRDFQALGHRVIHVGLGSDADVRLRMVPSNWQSIWACLPAGWRPDLVVVGDHSGQPIVVGLEFLEIPLVWYAIDSHIHLSWHQPYASVFDVVFVAQKGYVAAYGADPVRQIIEWMPVFCDTHVDRRIEVARDVSLSFVGTLNPRWNPARVQLIDRLRTNVAIEVQTGPYVELFNRSRMVLNQCVADEINFRTMQAMACGALLLMPQVGHGFDELFQDGTHCAIYRPGDVEQIVDLVRFYERHDGTRRRLADRGYAAVQEAHTSLHRARRILEVVTGPDVPAMVRARRTKLLAVQSQLAQVYRFSANKYRAASDAQPADSAVQIGQRSIAAQYQALADIIQRELRPFRSPAAE